MCTQNVPEIESALLLINRSSGNGFSRTAVAQLRDTFHASFAMIANRVVEVTEDHGQVERRTRDFLTTARGPCLLLAGGGGGTNRALVQGLLELAEQGRARLEDVWISALRAGSGNLVPKYFGMPREPPAGLRAIAGALFAGEAHPCCVYRCTFAHLDGTTERIYGLTMGGVGQFGRVPDDIKHWRETHPRLTRWLARHVSLEAINTAQYVAFSLLRGTRCIVRPRRAELVEVRSAGRCERLRLLAGVLLNFDFADMPIRAGCAIGEPRLSLCLVPHTGRRATAKMLLNWRDLRRHIHRFEIVPGRPVELLFPDQHATTLALDEDTFTAPARITFEVAGTVRFVAGTEKGEFEGPPSRKITPTL